MAKKRMFSLEVVDTDDFLSMPSGAQALYFQLGMHGDDDGIVASPQKIMRAARCRKADMENLVSRGYIIPFNSGVIAIRDWRINNDLKNDRYHPTLYTEEMDTLTLDDSKRYMRFDCLPHSVSIPETEHNVTQANKTYSNRTQQRGV